MNFDIKAVSERLKGTREYLDITDEEMAVKTKTDINSYRAFEKGERDISLSFLNDCAAALGIELLELLTGETPKLKKYSLTRDGKGLPIERRADLRIGFNYQHMAHLFSHKKVEPIMVTAPYSEKLQNLPISLSTHDGQEMNVVMSGQLKVAVGEHVELLNEGDCIYFDASNPHGAIAIGGKDCKFLAVLI